MKQIFEILDVQHEAAVLRGGDGVRIAMGEGEPLPARLRGLTDGEYLLEVGGAAHRVWVAVRGDMTFVHAAGANWSIRRIDPLDSAAGAGHGTGEDSVQAPMPGTVMRVEVKVGDTVHRGQTMVVIESMKMETSINAWRDGVVAEMHYPVGATFERKAPLVTLEPEATE